MGVLVNSTPTACSLIVPYLCVKGKTREAHRLTSIALRLQINTVHADTRI